LLFGKLNLPLESLRVIEESSSTPEEMQKNMGFVDECGNPSMATCYKSMHLFKNSLQQHLLQMNARPLRKFTTAARKNLQH
jgi:hypothetical protein